MTFNKSHLQLCQDLEGESETQKDVKDVKRKKQRGLVVESTGEEQREKVGVQLSLVCSCRANCRSRTRLSPQPY